MKNKSKIKITDLSAKVNKPNLKPLSDAETSQIVGGQTSYLCPGFPSPYPGESSW